MPANILALLLAFPLLIGIPSRLAASDLSSLSLRGWSFLREDASEWRVPGPGTLELRTQPGRIWAGEGARNLFLSPPATAEPVLIQATVQLLDPHIKFEQAGLLAYVNDDHFVKFVVEHIDGESWVVSGIESPGKRGVLSKTRLPSLTAHLALELHGDTVLCRYREADASTWKLASTSLIPSRESRRLGFFTQDGAEDRRNWARFTALHNGPAHLTDPEFGIRQVAAGCAFTEGPALSPKGNLYFSDGPNNRILKLNPNGELSTFLSPCGAANGLLFDHKGRLLLCQSSREGGGRAVARMKLTDDEPTIRTREFEGARYIAPNDLAIDGKGRIYFTDPYYGGEK